MGMLAEERLNRLRSAMGTAQIDAMVLYGNAWQGDYLRYASDFGILEGHGIAVVTRDEGVQLFLDSAADAERAEIETPAAEIHLVRDVARAVGAWLDRAGNRHTAAAPRGFLPHGLTETESGKRLSDATAVVDELLMHKLPSEVATIRRAAKLADEGYNVFKAAARPGRRQYELVADVEAFLRANGSADNFMIIGSGGQDVYGMAPPSERRLAPGDLVTTELTPSIGGYYAQICRTLVVGKANAAQTQAFAVYREALEAGIAAVRPGVTAADVARAENDVFRKYGLGDYVTNKYTRVRGHGMGLFADSKPHILEDVDTKLVAGMALIVHPNTYHPEVGYMVLGDAVVVTDGACEVLCATPRELFEVPV
jgi:Xaa-Pro aminopeptidase